MNCLTYAFGKWLREGGYVLMRRSRLAEEFGIVSKWHVIRLVPHFLHRGYDHVVTQYTASEDQKIKDKQRGLFMTWINLWNFDGVIIGDDKKAEA